MGFLHILSTTKPRQTKNSMGTSIPSSPSFQAQSHPTAWHCKTSVLQNVQQHRTGKPAIRLFPGAKCFHVSQRFGGAKCNFTHALFSLFACLASGQRPLLKLGRKQHYPRLKRRAASCLQVCRRLSCTRCVRKSYLRTTGDGCVCASLP